MKIAVIGTGMVGRALVGRLAGFGHDVVIGTRDVEQTPSAEPGTRRSGRSRPSSLAPIRAYFAELGVGGAR